MAKSFRPKNDVVYHCIPVTPKGDTIIPGTNYGAVIPDTILQKFNAVAKVKTPLVFAAVKQSKAVAYGFQFATGEALSFQSIEIDGQEQEVAFVCNRKETMSRQRDATIYEISRKDFIELNSDQCVYDKPVPFKECQIAYRIRNAEDIMRGGVQVISFAEEYEELMKSSIWKEFCTLFSRPNFEKEIGNWVRDGKIFWENNERQVNAHPGFAKMLGLDTEQPRKKSPKPILNRNF